jgi:glycosyltransferase involved in cell wall biosynthesis
VSRVGDLVAAGRGFVSDVRHVRPRLLPTFRVGPSAGAPTAYYLTPHTNAPSGGVRVLYRHVDTLNAMGISAAVLHAQEGFRCAWFENDTRIVYPRNLVLSAQDVLVVPEYYGVGLSARPPEVRVVVFNQNAYRTFDALPPDARPGDPYAGVPSLTSLMTVSTDNQRFLELAFPDLPVHLCRPVVDRAIFHPGADEPRGRVLGYVRAHRPREAQILERVMAARRPDWSVVAASGLSERQIAELLRRCSVFVSFSELEGFGLPPAEAMASGAYVVGYTGGGGDEFFDPAFCRSTTGTLELVEAVLEATDLPEPERRRRGQEASAAVLGRYDDAGLRADLRATFEQILA